jgi:hypothetical protein
MASGVLLAQPRIWITLSAEEDPEAAWVSDDSDDDSDTGLIYKC